MCTKLGPREKQILFLPLFSSTLHWNRSQDSPDSMSQMRWPKHLSSARLRREEQRLREDRVEKLRSGTTAPRPQREGRLVSWCPGTRPGAASAQQAEKTVEHRAPQSARALIGSSETSDIEHSTTVTASPEGCTESRKPQTVRPPLSGAASTNQRCRRDGKPCPHNGGGSPPLERARVVWKMKISSYTKWILE